MTSKLLIFLTTCVLFQVHAADIEKRENAESYITREAAKELRNKLSHIKNDGNVEEQQDDYDEILKEIIQTMKSQGPKEQKQPKQQQPTVFYEKKYFDYLPNEISDSDDVTSEDSSHELVKKHGDYNSLEDEQHMVNNDAMNVDEEENEKHGRHRRDVMQQDGENKARTKRQSLVYVPLTHYAPNPRVHFYFPSFDPLFTDIFNPIATESRQFQSFGAVPQQKINQQYERGINPYSPQANPNMRFYPAYNYYLPPSPTYLPAVQPNQQPNNYPYPPDNQGNKLGDSPNEVFDNRVGGFEKDEERPVWSSSFIPNNNKGGSGGSIQGRPISQTPIRPINNQQNQQGRPPRPNLISEDEKVFSPNEKPEVELEFAPELEEDVTSTTRASVKLPNRKKNQQNRNRQKKEGLQTTEQPPSTTSNIQSLYSQQVNSPMPRKPLSKCVEAIVNCCSKYDDVVRVPCFEAHNCNGAFFGQNPCSRSIKQAAFKEVEKYT